MSYVLPYLFVIILLTQEFRVNTDIHFGMKFMKWFWPGILHYQRLLPYLRQLKGDLTLLPRAG